MIGRALIYLLLGIVLVSMFNIFGPKPIVPKLTLNSSQLLADAREGKIRNIRIAGLNVRGVLTDNQTFASTIKREEFKPLLVELSNHPLYTVAVQGSEAPQGQSLIRMLPWLILFIAWLFVLRTMRQKQGK